MISALLMLSLINPKNPARNTPGAAIAVVATQCFHVNFFHFNSSLPNFSAKYAVDTITAILTGIIAAGLGVILRKPKYEVKPIYENKNLIKIKLDCIFSVHLMQYIYKLFSNKIKDLGKENLNKKVEV